MSAYSALVLADSPVAYWRLGEPSGTSMTDSSPSGYTGTYYNTPTLGVAGVISGDADTAISFDPASSEYADVPNTATALNNIQDTWTLEAWIYPTATRATLDQAAGIITRDSDGMAFIMAYGNVSFGSSPPANCVWIAFYMGAGGGYLWKGTHDPTAVTLNTWVYYAGTWDNTTLRIYKNGTEVGTSTPGAAATAQTSITRVGRRWGALGATDYFPGSIDEVAIYNTVLTPTKIAAHYTASQSVAPTLRTVRSNLQLV